MHVQLHQRFFADADEAVDLPGLITKMSPAPPSKLFLHHRRSSVHVPTDELHLVIRVTMRWRSAAGSPLNRKTETFTSPAERRRTDASCRQMAGRSVSRDA